MIRTRFTATAISKIMSLSAAHVGRLARDGTITKGDDEKYGIGVVAEYIGYLRKGAQGRSNYTELFEAEKYRQKKRENDLAENLIAPAQVLEDVLERGVAAMIPILEGIPLHLKRAWPEITGDQVQLVKQAVAECRNILADLEINLNE